MGIYFDISLILQVAYGKELRAYFSGARDKNVCMWQDGLSEPTCTFCGHELVVTGLAINSGWFTYCFLYACLEGLVPH